MFSFVHQALAWTGTVPLVFLFILGSAVVLSHATYQTEYASRLNFLRVEQQKYEEQRSSNLLSNMLPLVGAR